MNAPAPFPIADAEDFQRRSKLHPEVGSFQDPGPQWPRDPRGNHLKVTDMYYVDWVTIKRISDREYKKDKRRLESYLQALNPPVIAPTEQHIKDFFHHLRANTKPTTLKEQRARWLVERENSHKSLGMITPSEFEDIKHANCTMQDVWKATYRRVGRKEGLQVNPEWLTLLKKHGAKKLEMYVFEGMWNKEWGLRENIMRKLAEWKEWKVVGYPDGFMELEWRDVRAAVTLSLRRVRGRRLSKYWKVLRKSTDLYLELKA